MKRVIIAGGGLAGVNFIKRLSDDTRFHITLVDHNNYHVFPPLLYQVGTAFIEPSSISHPFRKMFQYKENLRLHLGGLTKVNPEQKTIETINGTLEYDYLVLAVGTETNYFGMKDVEKNALPLKKINDALTLRNRILLNMEKASRLENRADRKKFMNIVIGGGGPTGVEIAGVLAEMGRAITPKEYPELKDVKANIYLVEAGPDLLGPMSKKSQKEAYKQLTRLGVEIILNTAVTGYEDGRVLMSDGKSIPSFSFIWTSGVIAREIPGLPETSIGPGRRVKVNDVLQVESTEDIFAIGDISLHVTDPDFPQGHPQLAQVAIQQGNLTAENIMRIEDHLKMKSFRYYDKGTLAIISKFRAVADLPKMHLQGPIAWIIWLFIHIIPIASFRNKFILAFNWAWAFFTNDPTLRLIIGIYRTKNKE